VVEAQAVDARARVVQAELDAAAAAWEAAAAAAALEQDEVEAALAAREGPIHTARSEGLSTKYLIAHKVAQSVAAAVETTPLLIAGVCVGWALICFVLGGCACWCRYRSSIHLAAKQRCAAYEQKKLDSIHLMECGGRGKKRKSRRAKSAADDEQEVSEHGDQGRLGNSGIAQQQADESAAEPGPDLPVVEVLAERAASVVDGADRGDSARSSREKRRPKSYKEAEKASGRRRLGYARITPSADMAVARTANAAAALATDANAQRN